MEVIEAEEGGSRRSVHQLCESVCDGSVPVCITTVNDVIMFRVKCVCGG